MAADILLRGAAVYTMDARRQRARNIAIAAGRIVACELESLDDLVGPGTRVLDLDGRAVVPGFVDAHIHFGSYAVTRQQVDLDLAPTLDDGAGRRPYRYADLAQGRVGSRCDFSRSTAHTNRIGAGLARRPDRHRGADRIRIGSAAGGRDRALVGATRGINFRPGRLVGEPRLGSVDDRHARQ